MLRSTLLSALALASVASAQIPLPAFSSTLSSTSLTRGFFFQTPIPIVIVGLRVPDETKAGLQNVEVYQLTSAPATYPSTSSATHVFYSTGLPSDVIIPCALPFKANDYVAV